METRKENKEKEYNENKKKTKTGNRNANVTKNQGSGYPIKRVLIVYIYKGIQRNTKTSMETRKGKQM